VPASPGRPHRHASRCWPGGRWPSSSAAGYTPLAFGRRRLWAATAGAALLFAIMARYAFLARRLDQTAAVLAVPEVAWTAYATVLSTAVAAKNG
jgi:tryptophan-rich sensory protein